MFLLMAGAKVKMINVRLKPEVHDAFKTACDLRGGSMSSLMHQFIVRTIREEKEREPQAFIPKGQPIAKSAQTGILHKREIDTKHKRKAQ